MSAPNHNFLTARIRDGFADRDLGYPNDDDLEEFDSWLAAERARIWAECDAAITAHVERSGTSVEGWPVNPYRGDAA